MKRSPSPWLYAFLRGFEKFRPTAYRPTRKDVWTIGFGHTKGVDEGDTCTLAQAEAFLEADVSWAADAVNDNVKAPLNQNQFDALVSLCFNIGGPAFDSSTLVAKLNAHDYAGAADQFLRWNKQAGQVLDGLTRRRADERAHFLSAA